MVTATITGLASSVPPHMTQRELWDGFFAHHYQRHPLAQKVWERAGIERRHGAIDPRNEDISLWGTGERMHRFVAEALPLGKDAVSGCLAEAGLVPADVDQLTVVSCTGYATPGLDILLARDLAMGADLQRVHIGHMGCYAAVPGLATVADAVAARGGTAVLLCLELPSLHLQPATDEPDQMVAHALFADAAAAVVIQPDRPGLAVVDVVARTDVASAPLMTWDVTDRGFRMGLSPEVPEVLAQHVESATAQLLERNHLTVAGVAHWAVHPGGPKIVEVVSERLGLHDEHVAASRAVLRDFGNCSSATLLLILERMVREQEPQPGEHVVAMAFGPGLTLYAVLLRMR